MRTSSPPPPVTAISPLTFCRSNVPVRPSRTVLENASVNSGPRPNLSLARAALRLESLLDVSRELIGLALDVPRDLIDLTLDVPGDVVSQVVPVSRLCGRHSRHGDKNEGKDDASLDHAH